MQLPVIWIKGASDLAQKKKFYAVKNGKKNGIYENWSECQEQTHGWPNALFKSFLTRAEAEKYMVGDKISSASPIESADVYRIYVDGSYMAGRYSWGIAAYCGEELIYIANGIGESADAARLHNVAGEVEAACQAVKWALSKNIEHIIILHDYIGISEWAEGRWKTNTSTTQAYADFMSKYRYMVTFQKVSGHTGVTGNELADKLAKEALS